MSNTDLNQQETIGFFKGLYIIFTKSVTTVAKLLAVVDTNVDSLQAVSDVGQLHANKLKAEATKDLQNQLDKIS